MSMFRILTLHLTARHHPASDFTDKYMHNKSKICVCVSMLILCGDFFSPTNFLFLETDYKNTEITHPLNEQVYVPDIYSFSKWNETVEYLAV